MDFVTGLPTVQGGYDSIMVIVDMLTKVAHLIPVKTTYTAADIAKVFIKEVFRIHGLPKRIVKMQNLPQNFGHLCFKLLEPN